MRDLPLNKQQRKEGCIVFTFLGVLLVVALTLLYYAVNK